MGVIAMIMFALLTRLSARTPDRWST